MDKIACYFWLAKLIKSGAALVKTSGAGGEDIVVDFYTKKAVFMWTELAPVYHSRGRV